MSKRSQLLAELDQFATELESVSRDIELKKQEYSELKAGLESELRRINARLKAEEAEASSKHARIALEIEELSASKELAEKSLRALVESGEATKRLANEAQKRREAAEEKARREAEVLDDTLKQRRTAQKELEALQEALAKATAESISRETSLIESANKLAALEARRDELSAASKILEQSKADLEFSIKNLDERKILLLKEVESFDQNVKASAETLARLKAEISTVEEEQKRRVREFNESFEKDEQEARAKHLNAVSTLEHELEELRLETLEKSRQTAEMLAAEQISAAEVRARKEIEEAKKNAENLRRQAEEEASQTREKALVDYRATIKEAVEQQQAADALKASIQSDYDARLQEAEEAANRLRTDAKFEADTLRENVKKDYDAELEKAKKQSFDLVQEANKKAESLRDAAQKEYDVRLANADDFCKRKIAENEAAVSKSKAVAEARLAQAIKDAEDQVAQRVEAATEEAERLQEAARTALQNAKQEAAKAAERLDSEMSLKRQQALAEISAKKSAAGAEIQEWQNQEKKKAKILRKKQAEEAALVVRQLVESRATNFVVSQKSPFDVTELADFTQRAVHQILMDDGVSEKDKMMKYVADDGAGRLRGQMRRKKILLRSTYIILVCGLVVAISIAAYRRISTAKDRPDAGGVYAEKILNSRKTERMYSGQQTSSFKKTYVENVLFTKNYAAKELDRKYQDRWIVALNHFIVHKLDVTDKILVKIVPMEASLIRRLDKIAIKMTPATEKEYRSEMNKIERDVTADMRDLLGSDKKFREFKRFKKEFYEDNAGGK